VSGPPRRTVQVPRGQLEVLVRGEGGRTVATAHPLEPIDRVLPLLAEMTGARVVCVNPRGVGGSSAPARPRDSTLDGMADDLDAVRRALGLRRWVLWGMSGGSMIAQVYARRHPRALQALVLDSAGSCFADTLRDPECVLSPAFPRWREALGARGLAPDSDRGEASRTRVADAVWEEVPGAGWVLRHRSGPVLLVSVREPTDQMRRVMPGLLGFDARPWLGEIRVPVLVLGGAGDQVAPPAHLRALHDALPRSHLALLDGAGHVPIGERPAGVGAAVRPFLDGLPPPAAGQG
jgi:pimeloyl-ACP methyl ester carboxylesterase